MHLFLIDKVVWSLAQNFYPLRKANTFPREKKNWGPVFGGSRKQNMNNESFEIRFLNRCLQKVFQEKKFHADEKSYRVCQNTLCESLSASKRAILFPPKFFHASEKFSSIPMADLITRSRGRRIGRTTKPTTTKLRPHVTPRALDKSTTSNFKIQTFPPKGKQTFLKTARKWTSAFLTQRNRQMRRGPIFGAKAANALLWARECLEIKCYFERSNLFIPGRESSNPVDSRPGCPPPRRTHQIMKNTSIHPKRLPVYLSVCVVFSNRRPARFRDFAGDFLPERKTWLRDFWKDFQAAISRCQGAGAVDKVYISTWEMAVFFPRLSPFPRPFGQVLSIWRENWARCAFPISDSTFQPRSLSEQRSLPI